MTDSTRARQRVLHIAPTPFFADRGCHMRIAGVVRSLEAQGFSNRVCTYHLGRDVAGIETVRTWRIPGYTQTSAGHSGYKYIADILLAVLVCYQVIRYKPTVIHGHLHEGALLGHVARLLVFWRRTPLVFDVQGSLVGELIAYGKVRPGSMAHRVFRLVESLVCRLPDVFMCSSQNSLEILRDEYGVVPARLMVTADGTDVEAFAVPESPALRKALGLPEDRPVAVFSGSLLAAKGIEELRQLIQDARRSSLKVHFLVIGYPDTEFRGWLAEQGLDEFVTPTGQLAFEKLPDYLALAAVAIEPKAVFAGEASGKLINYMAAGLPVVCFESGHNRAVLADGGFYAPLPGQGLLPALREALDEGAAPLALRGAANRARAAARYSWDAMARLMSDRYRELLEARR